MPAYQETKPLAADKLSDSQADIANNFTAIKALVDVNHETFAGGVSPEGKHKIVTLPERDGSVAKPYPVNLANEGALFAKEGPTSTTTELFFRREDGTDSNMTERGGTTAGWTFIPSGLLVKWGDITTTATSTVNLNTVAGPNFSAVYAAQATPKNTNGGVAAAYIVGTTLQVRTPTAGMPTCWIVIGLPA